MADPAPRSLRTFRRILWALVAVVAIGATAFYLMRPVNTAVGVNGGRFALQSTTGGNFTDASLKGVPSLVFFGYTFCPDVCPTTLAEMTAIRDQLGVGPDKLRIIFATVDPERDTIDAMTSYLAGYGEGIVGLTGTPAEVTAAEAAFGVFAERRENETEPEFYFMDHTATVFLLNADGQFEGTIAYGEGHDTAVGKVKRLIGA
ncbi:MAG: hypothetical protein JWR75_2052 [Devosia sp.]|nr:hypothetical protein [Devosia sp.]